MTAQGGVGEVAAQCLELMKSVPRAQPVQSEADVPCHFEAQRPTACKAV